MFSRIRNLKYLVPVAMAVAMIAIWRFDARAPSHVEAHARTLATRTVPGTPAVSGSVEHEVKMLNSALKKNPNHVPILLKLARMASDSGHSTEAIERLQEAVRAEPNNVAARLDLGKLLFEKGDVWAAIEQNQAILKTSPEDPDALYNLGAIYGNLGNAGLAERYWTRLLTTGPESESGRRARAMMDLLRKESGPAK